MGLPQGPQRINARVYELLFKPPTSFWMQISFLSNWEKCDMCQSLEIRDLFCSRISEALVFGHPRSTWVLLSAGQSCLPLLGGVCSAEDVDLSQEAVRQNDSRCGGAGISAWDTARSLGERKGVGGCYFQTALTLAANFAASCSFYCSCSGEATGVNITLGNLSNTHLWTTNTRKHRLAQGTVLADSSKSASLTPGAAQQGTESPCSSYIPSSWSTMTTHKPQLPLRCSCPNSYWPCLQKEARNLTYKWSKKKEKELKYACV